MLEPLHRITNPAIRTLTAATTGLSLTTVCAAIAIGVFSPQDEAAHRLGVYAALAGGGTGAAIGLLSPHRDRASATKSSPALAPQPSWTDWRNFVVVRKVQESREITSFYLQPQDGQPLPPYWPGQFLTIRIEIPDRDRPVIRTYSLSDAPHAGNYYRLSIKREAAPKDLKVPPGVASNFMHDHVEVGTIIAAKPPSGKFFLDITKTTPAILISNGVGITPMIAMAKAAAHLTPNRPLWFLHGARDGSYHAFREEVGAIAKDHPNLKLHYCYSRPRPEDANTYHSQGYVDARLIQQHVLPTLPDAIAEAEYFLCGSPAFMDALRTGLQTLGVPAEQIFFEAFTKAPKATEPTPLPTASNGQGKTVVFAASGKTAVWEPSQGTLLEFAEESGLEPAYSCRQGICLTCMCKLREGEVEYLEPPIGQPDAGSVLICISRPKTSQVVLEL